MTTEINYSELIPVLDELTPSLKAVTAEQLPINPKALRFVEIQQKCIRLNGTAKHYTETGLRSSASLFVVKPNAQGIWTVLVKEEAKAFKAHTVLTPPGGYMEKRDFNNLAHTALRKGYEETGLPVSPDEVMTTDYTPTFWIPEGTSNPLIDLDCGTPPAPYPNNTTAVQASFMLVVKDAELLIRRNKQMKDGWRMVRVFPKSRSAEDKAEWSRSINPHGVAAHGLRLVQEHLLDEDLSTRTGQVTEKWRHIAA